jgi:hypothetical protein
VLTTSDSRILACNYFPPALATNTVIITATAEEATTKAATEARVATTTEVSIVIGQVINQVCVPLSYTPYLLHTITSKHLLIYK